MKVVELNKDNKDAMKDVLETIRKLVEEGKAHGFAAVVIEEDDATSYFTATAKNISRLRFMGATNALNMWIMHEDFE